jgi:hypothetical protein
VTLTTQKLSQRSALEAIRNGIAENRAAKASAGMVLEMEGLGVGGPSDVQTLP